MSTQSDLAELYTAFFNRAPDSAGLAYWVNQLSAGTITLGQIAKNWVESQPEGQAKYPAGMSTTDFVNAIYDNVLSRVSDTAGLAYWKGQLDSGAISRDTFVATVINGAKSNTSTQGKADAALVANKATVGIAFADKGLNDVSLAAKVLTSVTADSNTLTATLDLLKLVPSAAAGQTTAVLAALNTALGNVANLIKTAPGELADLATYLNTVVSNISSGTNLATLFTSINTKVVAAQTNPSALDNPATQAGTDVTAATPTTGGGDTTPPVTTPTFTVTNGTGLNAGTFTIGTLNGDVKVTLTLDGLLFTPTTGTAVAVKTVDITQGLVANGSVTVSADILALATLAHPVTGAGTIHLTASSTVTAANLISLDSLVTPKLDATALTGSLTGTQAQLLTVLSATTITGLAAKAVTISDSVSIAQVKAVDDKTTGAVTATQISDTAAHLDTNVGGYVKSGVTVTYTDTATVAQLTATQTLTGVTPIHGDVTDTIAHLLAGLNTVPPLVEGFVVQDSLANVLAENNNPTLPTGFSYTLTDGNLTVPADQVLTVAEGQGALSFLQAIVDHATNHASITLNAVFSLEDTVAHLTAAQADPLSVLTGRTYSINDSLENFLAAKADITSTLDLTHYSLTDAIVDLGVDLGVADAATAQTHAQAVVDGASNVPPLTLDATFTVTDSIANLILDTASTNPVTAGHDYSITDTLANIVADKASESLLTYSSYSLTDTSFDFGSHLTVQQLITAEAPVTDVYNDATGITTPLVLSYSLTDTVEHLVDNAPLLNGHTFTVNDSLLNVSEYLDGDTSVLSDEFAYSLTDANITISASTNVETALGYQQYYTGLVNGASNKADLDLKLVINLHDTAADLTDEAYASVVAGQNVTITDEFVTLDQLSAVAEAVGNGTGAGYIYNGVEGTILELLGAGELTAEHGVYVTDAASIQQLTDLAATGVDSIEYFTVIDTVAALTDADNADVVLDKTLVISGTASVSDVQQVKAAAVHGLVFYTAVTDSVTNLTSGANAAIVNHHAAVITGEVSIQNITDVRTATIDGKVTYGTIADSVTNLTNVANAATINGHALSVNDTASVAQLLALKVAAGTATVTYSSITDTYANLTAQNAAGLLSGKVVDLSDATVSIAQINALHNAGATTVNYLAISDSLSNLTNPANAALVAHHDVVITDTVSVAQVGTVKAVANVGAVTYATLSDNAANLDAASSGILDAAATVSFTDAATIAQLTNVDVKTAATLAYSSVIDSAANLVTNAGTYVKNAVNVTVSDTASLAQLATIDLETTGTVTATNIADAAATLFTNAGGYVKAGVNVTVNDAATLAQLTSIDNANGTGTLTANIIADTAVLLAANVGSFVKAGVNVTVNDAASITQLTTIDGLNGNGALAYAAVSDTASALVANVGGYVKNAVNVTVSGAATLAQLSTINGNTTGTLTANQINDGIVALTDNTGSYVKAGVNVTVTDAASIAQLTALDGVNTTGTVTATTVTDNAANLFANAGGYIQSAVNVSVTGAASIAQLTAIDAKNGAGTLVYASLSDSSTNLLADINGSGTHYVTSGKNVEVTDSVSLTTLATIDAANGGGTLTATSVIDNAANLLADTAYISLTTAVTVSGVVNLANLKSIDDKSGVVTYHDIADNAAALLANTNGYVTGSVNITVNDGTSVLNLATIFVKATGQFHYSSIVDTAANLVQESNSANGFVQGDIAITVTDTISLANLSKLDLAITGVLSYSSITDNAVNLAADITYIKGSVAVVVSGAIDLTALASVDGKTTGTVTYGEVSGKAADLAADALTKDGDGTYVVSGKTIDVTDAATVQQLTEIKATILTGTLSYATVEDSAFNLAADAVTNSNAGTYITGKSVIVNDAATIAQLTAIDAVNAGVPTYTAISDTAANLTAIGASTYVTGSVNVTVTSAVAIADLATIDALITGKVTAANLSDAADNLVDGDGDASTYIGAGSSVTVSGNVTIAQLKAIDLANGITGTLTYTHISDSLENLNALGASAYIKAGITVTVTDSTATIAQLAALDAASVGGLDYAGAIGDTAEALAADAALKGGDGNYTDGKAVTVSDAATIAQLAVIDDVAASVSYTRITDDAAALAANVGSYVKNGVTVTVSNAATVAQLAAIDGFTDVALAYTKVTDSSVNLFADSTYVKAGVTVTLTDTGTVAATVLTNIDSKTDVQVNASYVTTVTGNVSDVKAALAANATLKLSGTEGLSVTDTAADLVGQTLNASTSTHDVLNVGLASVTSNLSGLTGFEDIYLAGSNRSTNAITIGDGDGVSVHAQATSTVVLGSGQQSFFTSTGNDTVTVNAGSTFVFASTGVANGVDLIKGFVAGGAGSALDFSSFFGSPGVIGNQIVDDVSDFGGDANTVTLLNGTSAGLVTKNAVNVADFNSGFLSNFSGKEVIVTFDNTAHSASVYFVNSAGGGAAGLVDNAADITLVGTVTYTGAFNATTDLHLVNHLQPV